MTPEERKAYHRGWYQRNRERRTQQITAYKKRRRQQLREWVAGLKLACIRCGERDYRCLDFHHVDPTQKEFCIAHAIHSCYPKSRIEEEIDKCVLLCANCHRKEHASIV
jgi:hypothetical protein